MTDEPTMPAPPTPVIVEPDPARREHLQRVLETRADAPRVRAVETVKALDEGEEVPLAVVGLDAASPIQTARALASHHDCRVAIFVGNRKERDRWSRPISYEPMLPPDRQVVALEESDNVAEVARKALAGVHEQRLIAPALESARTEAASIRESVETTMLDALDPESPMRGAYTAVVRGALSRLDEAAPERVPHETRRAVQSALRRIELLAGRSERERVAASLRDVLAGADEEEMTVDRLSWERFENSAAAREWLVRTCEDATLQDDATQSTIEALEVLGNTWPGARGHALEARYVPGGGRITFTWRDGSEGLLRLVMASPDTGAER